MNITYIVTYFIIFQRYDFLPGLKRNEIEKITQKKKTTFTMKYNKRTNKFINKPNYVGRLEGKKF